MRHATPLDVGNGVACGDRGGGDGGGDGEGGMTTRNRLTEPKSIRLMTSIIRIKAISLIHEMTKCYRHHVVY